MQAVVSPKKRRWQIRLRTLLLGVTAICIVLAFVLHRAREQQKAVHAIEEDYGNVFYNYQIEQDGTVDNSIVSWLPQWLSWSLAKHVFHSVVVVDLDSEQVTDATLAEVEKLRRVKALYISSSSITNDGLHVLKSMPALRVVILNTEGITDEATEHLAACPLLRELTFENAEITDSELMQLGRARQLKKLSLFGSKITSSGLLQFHLDVPNCVVEE